MEDTFVPWPVLKRPSVAGFEAPGDIDTPLGQRLHGWGIDLNSEVTGVWLPKYDYPGRKASIHRGRTSGTYTQIVTNLLDAAKSKEEALSILSNLKERLNNGSLLINNAK
jgi:hypothetical protein